MEVDGVTEFIRKILGKSEALQYCEYFKGISDEKFKSYSFEDLKHVLPSTEEGEVAATEIKEQIKLALKMEKVRAEIRAGGRVPSSSQPTQIEGQALCMDESGADVSSVDGIDVKILPPKLKEIVEITLDSDDEEVGQPQDSRESGVSSDEENSDSEDLSTSESSESGDSDVEGSRPKRKCRVELASTTGRPVRNCRARKQPVLNLGSKVNSAHTCMREEGSRDQKWYDEIHGQYCTTINAYQWCWQPLSHRCKYNLFRILCNSPNVEKLNIFNYATNTPADIDLPEGSLLKLKKLLVCRRGNMNTGNNLRKILKMAPNLKGFSYDFSTETEDLAFLKDIVWSKLQRLSIVSCSKPSYLKKAQIEKLSSIDAPKLKTLRMGVGLYEDVSGSDLEGALKKFPTLQNLRIPGQYYGQTGTHPEVAISFPKLTQLKYLNFGGSYDYAPSVNTHKKDESRTVDGERTKPFHVTLKFVEIWRKLKTLILGNMYHIDSLHLKCFPKLEVLRVGSPWHLSVVFPGNNARSYNYPLISDLQLPDGLNDASFLKIVNIPKRFPNLKTCRLALPSAIVLRALFNEMKDVRGLQELRLKTQFDFSSTLESCLLDQVLPIETTSEDWQRVTEFEKCAGWNEFVDQHNIILPLRTDEEVQAFVKATGEYGLGALKHLESNLELFYLMHIPRILRLPHVESNEAATTSTLELGYKKYPVSTKSCDAVYDIAMRFGWNLELPEGERERWAKRGYKLASDVDTTDDERTKIEASAAIDYSNSKEENKEKED